MCFFKRSNSREVKSAGAEPLSPTAYTSAAPDWIASSNCLPGWFALKNFERRRDISVLGFRF
jgi:hypothetical protein